MRLTIPVAAIAGLLLAAVPTAAQKISVGLGLGFVSGSPGPIDGIASAPSGAHSFRRLKNAYTGKAAQLRRASDNAVQDIGFTPLGDFDTAAATTFCAATSCFLAKWYDQSGNGRDATRAVLANQPAFIFNCNGALPCTQATANNQSIEALSMTPVMPVSFSAVANCSAGLGTCYWPLQFGSNNSIASWSVANQWVLYSAAPLVGSAAEGGWHTATAVLNGAASVLRIDGAETTGTLTGSTTAGAPVVFLGAASTTCSATEVIYWNGYALTATERAALAANQQKYWMPFPLDTFTPPSAAYSFRRLKSIYAGKAVRLRRASDNLELDIGFTTAGDFDSPAATTHCGLTTCYIAKWYDQSGTARDMAQPTVAGQLNFVSSCDAKPCARTLGVVGQSVFSPVFPAVLPVSLSAVGRRGTLGAGTPTCNWILQNGGTGNRLATFAGGWFLAGSANNMQFSPQPADNVWHAQQGVITSGASIFNIDGVENTGAVVGVTAASNTTIAWQGTTGTICDFAEAIAWDNYALTGTDRVALTANQRFYWGF